MQFVKRPFLALALLATTTTWSFGQSAPLLSKLPETKEEFVQTEKNVLATISWLETTPLRQDKEKHGDQYALLIGWISASPDVTISLNPEIFPAVDNPDLLMFFMAGWTKYALQNNYSKDELKGNLAGLREAINLYKKGEIPQDKKMDNLVALDKNGKLDKWVADQLAKNTK